jgi:hypothetical protein
VGKQEIIKILCWRNVKGKSIWKAKEYAIGKYQNGLQGNRLAGQVDSSTAFLLVFGMCSIRISVGTPTLLTGFS